MNRSCDDPDRILGQSGPEDQDFVDDQELGRDSHVAFAVLQEVQQAWRRRKELRNLLEVNDRKKLQFRPRPSRFGLKFKNKSEEVRYLKICGRVMQMNHMDPSQIEQLRVAIKRYLGEYLAHIRAGAAAPTSALSQPHTRAARRHPAVDDHHVGRFIEAIQRLHEQEE